jgi:uncharacterized protein (TIGR00730 family)
MSGKDDKDKKRVACGQNGDGSNPCVNSPVYRLAFEDVEYLHAPFLRGTRLLLEYNKPERILREQGVTSTVVVYGSARTLPEDVARQRLEEALARLDANPDDADAQEAARIARRDVKMSRWYEESRRFSAIVSRHAGEAGRDDFMVVTGGGPGIMEAANRGAAETGARSIGLNITLEHEQFPNPYISPDLCFRFHYFAIRKMHFMLRAKAMVAFPGGFGTMDELFKVLTLIQTGKSRPMPVVLVGRDFWSRLVNFDLLVEVGNISPEDLELFSIVDTAEEAVAAIHDYYGGNPLKNGAA